MKYENDVDINSEHRTAVVIIGDGPTKCLKILVI